MDMKGIPYCRRASTAMVLLVMITSIFAGITIAGDDPGIRVMRAFDLDGDGLDDRSTTDMEFPVWTFVHFDPHFSEDVLSSLVSSGAGIHASYTMVPVISARFHDMGEIEAFLDLEEDAGIEIQGSISLLQDVSVKAVKASRSTEYSPTTAQDLGMNGAGITIAIIDTGVDNEHSTFEGAFVAGADLSVPASPLTPRDGTYDPDDRTGHGTAVASIALGRGDTEGNMKGVASQAGLIDLKVVGNLPVSLNQNSLMDSLQWCSDNLDTDWRDGYSGVDVVSISLGIGDGSSAVALAMDDLVSSGVVVVQGSGNSGSSYSSGAGTTWSDLSIVVGGIDDRDTVDRTDDEYWSTSTTGPRTDDGDDDPYDELRPDVVAPAVGITFASSSRTSFIQPASGWSEGSGTSYATPHMSGVAALMLQARSSIVPSGTQNPVRRIVHQTSESAGDPYDSSLSENYNVRYGFGMLDAYSAVRGAMAYTGVNHRPEIVYFEVKPNETTAGSTCRVRALAVDPDEETLDYTLTIDDGEIAGKAPLWDWTAPGEPGKYYFNLEVSDPSGGTVTAKTSVLVKEGSPNRPPVITSFRSQEDTLTIGGSTSLTVVAIDQDGDPLTFDYNSRRGTIEGSGDEVTYTAPEDPMVDTITVTVSDGQGGSDSATMEIEVIEGSVNRPPSITLVSAEPGVINSNTSGLDKMLFAIVGDPDGPDDIDQVLADLSSIYGHAAVEMKNDGIFPDEDAGDLEYSLLLEDFEGLENGVYILKVTVFDRAGDSATGMTQIEVNMTSTSEANVGKDPNIDPVLVGVIIAVVLLLVLGIATFFVMKGRRSRSRQIVPPAYSSPRPPPGDLAPPRGTFRPVQPR